VVTQTKKNRMNETCGINESVVSKGKRCASELHLSAGGGKGVKKGKGHES